MGSGGESSAKIKLDVDATRVHGAADGLTERFKKTKQEAHGIGDGLEHVGEHLAKHLIGARALLHTFEKMGEAVRKYQEEAKKASETVGEDTLSRAQAGGALGLTGAETDAFTSPGIHSRKQSTAFLGQLAGIRIGRRPLSRDAVARATNLYRSGVFADHEITQALEQGNLAALEAQVGQRTELAGEEFQSEATTRGTVNQAEDQADNLRANPAYRRGEAAVRLRDARSPVKGFIADTIKGLPVFGHGYAAEEAEASSDTAAGRAVGGIANLFVGGLGGAIGSGAIPLLRRTAAAAERGAEAANRPTLPPGVE